MKLIEMKTIDLEKKLWDNSILYATIKLYIKEETKKDLSKFLFYFYKNNTINFRIKTHNIPDDLCCLKNNFDYILIKYKIDCKSKIKNNTRDYMYNSVDITNRFIFDGILFDDYRNMILKFSSSSILFFKNNNGILCRKYYDNYKVKLEDADDKIKF